LNYEESFKSTTTVGQSNLLSKPHNQILSEIVSNNSIDQIGSGHSLQSKKGRQLLMIN